MITTISVISTALRLLACGQPKPNVCITGRDNNDLVILVQEDARLGSPGDTLSTHCSIPRLWNLTGRLISSSYLGKFIHRVGSFMAYLHTNAPVACVSALVCFREERIPYHEAAASKQLFVTTTYGCR